VRRETEIPSGWTAQHAGHLQTLLSTRGIFIVSFSISLISKGNWLVDRAIFRWGKNLVY
jgi:hypothetical protein